MPNLVAISQATAKINRGGGIRPPQALSVSNHPGQIGLRYYTNISLFVVVLALQQRSRKENGTASAAHQRGHFQIRAEKQHRCYS